MGVTHCILVVVEVVNIVRVVVTTLVLPVSINKTTDVELTIDVEVVIPVKVTWSTFVTIDVQVVSIVEVSVTYFVEVAMTVVTKLLCFDEAGCLVELGFVEFELLETAKSLVFVKFAANLKEENRLERREYHCRKQ